MANALTLRFQKLDAVASVVRMTIALTLGIQKKFASTVSVCKKRAVSGGQMP